MTVNTLGPFVYAGGAIWIAGAALVAFLVWRLSRQPLTDTDRRCDAVDVDLDTAAAHERMWAERDAQIARAVDDALADVAWLWGPSSTPGPERLP